ncbi:hypothetical protein NE237_012675 [Protea cynaroides]|uniref:Uncharacterized protein n=1 Tax=Protea cynaroides TaxID=273540 RepID=A0A9Q0JY99_9MAGN|nr:hypothetical protein NE237_012675 [Protea cynaroides]
MLKSTGSQMGASFHKSPAATSSRRIGLGGVPKVTLGKFFSTLAQTPNFRTSLGQLFESDPDTDPDPPEGGHFGGGGGGGGSQEETKVKKMMLSIRKRAVDAAFEAIFRSRCLSRWPVYFSNLWFYIMVNKGIQLSSVGSWLCIMMIISCDLLGGIQKNIHEYSGLMVRIYKRAQEMKIHRHIYALNSEVPLN